MVTLRADKDHLVKHEGCIGCENKGCLHNGNVAEKEVAERSKAEKFDCNSSKNKKGFSLEELNKKKVVFI